MSTPTVIETPLSLEAVTSDPFVADLDRFDGEREARLTAFMARVAAAPHRRVFD